MNASIRVLRDRLIKDSGSREENIDKLIVAAYELGVRVGREYVAKNGSDQQGRENGMKNRLSTIITEYVQDYLLKHCTAKMDGTALRAAFSDGLAERILQDKHVLAAKGDFENPDSAVCILTPQEMKNDD